MGWIKRVLGIERRAEEVETESALLRSLLDDSDVTRETALQVPTISGGIDLLGALVASTPIKLYHEHDGKAHEIVGDPRIRLLNDETGDTLNANEFWRAMVRDYYLGKGGYAYIQRSGLSVIGLYYVDERNISVARGADVIFKEYDLLVQGKRYLPHDFLRILRNTRDGAEGIPITSESNTLISTAYQTLLLERKLALMGGNKKGFIQSAKKLTQEAIEQIRKSWNEIHSNNARADNIVVLNDGVTFKESSATSVELQLNENKRTNADEFAKIFHVPSGMIGGTATQSDIASLARLAAIPLMEAIECALNRDLLLESEKGSLYFAFDTKELLKADMQTRFNAYKTALDANFMQIDEVRFAEDLDPLGLTWIKLGLQDVLYDPRTKQIYTPNTNQTTQMDEQPLPTEGDRGIINERAQKRRPNGQFGESDGMGGDDGIDRGYTEKDYTNVTVGSDSNTQRTETGGFTEKGKEARHIARHMKDVGAKNEKEYKRMAQEFLSQPLKSGMDEMITSDGHRYRYDWKNNLLGIANPDGMTSTLYKPTEKGDYWRGKVKKFGRKED